MISIDTNLLLKATLDTEPDHSKALAFVNDHGNRDDFVLCELVLVELYGLLRTETVMKRKVSPAEACDHIQRLRRIPKWQVVENAPVMDEVWEFAAKRQFARRRIFDVRLGLTLKHHGVKEFATGNVKDFKDIGFQKVWNPLK